LVVKRGQASAPGMMSASSANIWQPLHTPRPKVSGAAEEGLELLGQHRVEGDAAGPADAGAQRVAVAEAAAGHHALEVGQLGAAGLQVGHVHVDRLRSRLR
jgi:hypothetical protein